jgi:class 3 adenylate cyclase
MRVERTFAFVDMCGFTRFSDIHGDEEAVVVLTRFRTLVREIASDHGVRVAKWLGDGAMFVSTEPTALIETILDLVGRSNGLDLMLPLRAGLGGGPVILFEGDDYIGGQVNLASRLCDAASPNEILASAHLMAAVPANADVQQCGHRPVPGFAQPVETICIEPQVDATPLPAALAR